ncbi:flagellar motor switch protein FliG [Loktanella atrilutea]|uniref:Flagellar motor switch protein FliG n=1 Tax=Loktanella atrilutea TaxID=366533 RepID=A0A1M4TWN3_LOKAT|nr:FliG C-terminal domain-containing protein [Loktanella atrilutea]SHE48846.1 flagellar motor switch protein FliG [Loktanella atrilutea]
MFNAFDPLPDAAPPTLPLSRKRKAALIVQLLINDGNKLALSTMPDHVQEDLARELGAIRLVDRDTVNAVATEFADLLDAVGLCAPGNVDAALEALAGQISPHLADKLRDQLDNRHGRDPWPRLQNLTTDDVVRILSTESIQIGAVLLSKLPVTRAAEVLGKIPGPRARRITFAVRQTSDIGPDAVLRIGQALVSDYCRTRLTAFDKAPVERVGAILNSSLAPTRDDVLVGLDETDADFAKNVRKAIFTFENIPARVRPIHIPNCLRAIDPADLATAIGYALVAGGEREAAATYIMDCISQRMAAALKEQAADRGTVKPVDGEAAMNAVSSAIRALADDGTITLIDPDEEEET